MSTLTKKNQSQENQLHETVTRVINHVKDNPSAKDISFSVESELRSGFHSDINVRDFHFIADEPESLGGHNNGPNPVEYVLGALAACQEIVIKAYAGQLGIEVDSIQVKASGDLDLQGFFNLSEERPGFNNVQYKTIISTNETDPEKLRLLKNFSVDRCPVLDIIANPVPVKGEIVYAN